MKKSIKQKVEENWVYHGNAVSVHADIFHFNQHVDQDNEVNKTELNFIIWGFI